MGVMLWRPPCTKIPIVVNIQSHQQSFEKEQTINYPVKPQQAYQEQALPSKGVFAARLESVTRSF